MNINASHISDSKTRSSYLSLDKFSVIFQFTLAWFVLAGSSVFANDEKNKTDIISDRLVIEVAMPSDEVISDIVDDRLAVAKEMLNKLDISENDKASLLSDYSNDFELSLKVLFADYYDQMVDIRETNIKELDSEFTTQEVEQIVGFFDSAIGKKYFRITGHQTQMTQQIGQQFQTSLSEDVASKLDDFITATKRVSRTNSNQ